MTLKDDDTVRICRLLTPERDYTGTERVTRPPRTGDTGLVVAVSGRGDERTWVVESVNAVGETVWLADFQAEELEKIPDGRGRPAEAGPVTYLVGALVGAGAAYLVASRWLGLAAPWQALAVGAVAALYGVFSLSTLVEALVLTVFLGAMTALLITALPGLVPVKAFIAAGACGLGLGKIVVGLRRGVRS